VICKEPHKKVNYLNNFVRQEQDARPPQTEHLKVWDEIFYRTYAQAKHQQIKEAYDEFTKFLESLDDFEKDRNKMKESVVCMATMGEKETYLQTN